MWHSANFTPGEGDFVFDDFDWISFVASLEQNYYGALGLLKKCL